MSLYVAVLLMVRRYPDTWWQHAMRDARVAALQSVDEEWDDDEPYRDHEWDEDEELYPHELVEED
jgi:hypothetical protein